MVQNSEFCIKIFKFSMIFYAFFTFPAPNKPSKSLIAPPKP